MTTRQYSSRSQQSTLTGAISAAATSMTVVSGSALLGGVSITAGTTFTLVIDPDTALEEIVDATAVSTNTFTITRGVETGGTGQSHSAGAVVRHMAIGRDFRDANLHAEADASYNDGAGVAHTMHGIGAGEGVVVGTLKAQTLTQKTLTTPTINGATITGAVTMSATATVTGAIVVSGGTISGLSTPATTSEAAPKGYVDSILGSATAASTSAAAANTSAVAASTSAANASVSAAAASTSAAAANTSAVAASTSVASASTSAAAASTSAANASASAAAANTSAVNASTSAANASASAASATTSQAAANTSAVAASTSAANALVSANSASAAASQAASAIQATIFDAKGDIIVASAADTAARLGVGTDGQILTAASTATYGLQWAAAPVSLPSQSGNAGKYLTTDGSTASWAAITTDPTPTVFLLMGA
jgi:hypothetical protein